MELELRRMVFTAAYRPNLILIRNASIVASCSTQLKVIKVRRMCLLFFLRGSLYLGVASEFYPAFSRLSRRGWKFLRLSGCKYISIADEQ